MLFPNFEHWTGALVTISTIATSHPTVCVYDSLYSCAGTHLKAQIAAVMATEEPELILEFMDVPIQSGSYHCGLFAIAFATALALREKLELFFFDQWNMRAHLRQCFGWKDENVSSPPKAESKMSAVKTTEEVQVYWKCRMPGLPGEPEEVGS